MFSLVMIPFSKYCYCYSLAWRSFRDASPMDPVLRMDDSSNDSGVVVVAAAAAAAAAAVAVAEEEDMKDAGPRVVH